MRRHSLALIAVTFVSGCSLYFGNSPPSSQGDDVYVPPQEVDGGTWLPDASVVAGGYRIARCEDGAILAVDVGEYDFAQPPHGAGEHLGTCPGACRSDSVECADSTCANATAALCAAPISRGKTCELDGTTCAGSGSIACPQTTTCGQSEPGATCACSGGVYSCTEQSPVAETQAALVGKWHGTVTTPGFGPPYPVSLWIYPDGTYWAECAGGSCSVPFYYGGTGPLPDRKLEIMSVSPTDGAWADVAIDFNGYLYGTPPNTGSVSALTVDATTLRFTFNASWFDCAQPFVWDLTRQ